MVGGFSEPSTHVLTPPKIGALREVASDNMYETFTYLSDIWSKVISGHPIALRLRIIPEYDFL